MTLKLGDIVLLFYPERKKSWLVKIEERELHTHLGKLDLKGLIGREWGEAVTTQKGKRLFILRPTLEDMIMKFERRTQIVYPKDAGLILIRLDIGNGSKVLEIGTGSGAMTALLARAVAPNGKVVTYEVRKDFYLMARRNLERTGLLPYIEMINDDAKKAIKGSGYDAAMVDIGDPWDIVGKVANVLKPSGTFAAVTPTMNQAERLTNKLEEEGFTNIECFELMYRRIEARLGKTRPSTQMVGHTAYVITARFTFKRS